MNRELNVVCGLLNPVKDEAIVAALQYVLGEDANSLGEAEIDCVKTVIEAFVWSKESDEIVRAAVQAIKLDMGLTSAYFDEEEAMLAQTSDAPDGG